MDAKRDAVEIVCVDNSRDFLRVLGWLFEAEGYACTTFSDPFAALEYLASPKGPRVLLLDYRMPDIDAPAFLARLRSGRIELPIVLVTGLSPGSIGSMAGVATALHKPVTAEAILAAIAAAIDPLVDEGSAAA